MAATKSLGDAKLDKVKTQLDGFLTQGKLYEAQQLYQTLQSRLCAQKNYDDAQKLMLQGVEKLIEHKAVAGAGQLALLIVDTLIKSECKATSAHIELLLKTASLFPKGGEEAGIGLLKAALKWACSKGSDKEGDPRLHQELARLYWRTDDCSSAQNHFLRANLPHEHAHFLFEWSSKGYGSERDLYLSRCVLQYLCLGNLQAANTVFKDFRSSCQDKQEALDSPLVNFVAFLLQTVERDAAPLYLMLRQKYAISLSRDSTFSMYLDKIGEVFFKIKAPGDMFENMLKMI
jgi:hypothetical protein